MTAEFQAFPKISRLNRDMVVTEKIDGTNAAVGVTEEGEVYAQSRKRLIVPGDDNFGFALWVSQHEDELRDGLGIGLHFGEWWGLGIQRNYDLSERRFSLFNTGRWSEERPDCCGIVPVLAQRTFDTNIIHEVIENLRTEGSRAAPGFMKPEGIVVFHAASYTLFKATLEDDEKPKGQA